MRLPAAILRSALVALLFVLNTQVYAEVLPGNSQPPTGGLRSGVAVERDLGRPADLEPGPEKHSGRGGYLAVEHPAAVLPNLRTLFSGINANGNEVLARSIELNGSQFAFSDTVNSVLELSQADAVFYYELSDTLLSLDFGVAARYLVGEMDLLSTTQSARAEFSSVMPLLYAATRFDFPLSGFWLGAQAMGVAYDGDKLYDFNAQLGWETSVGIGAELGWRSFQLVLEDSDELERTAIEMAGPYLSVNYYF